MRILITGSSGFIGGHLKRALPDADGLDIRSAPTTNIVANLTTHQLGEDYDVIYHMAARTNLDQCMKNPLGAYINNVCATMNLLRQFNGDLFVFPSTVGVPSKNWDNPYIYSKAACEWIVPKMTQNAIILRFQNIYGPGSKSVISKFLDEKEITVYGDGNQKRDFVWIGDLIDHLVGLMEEKPLDFGYVGTGKTSSINELVTIITKLQGMKPINYADPREGDIVDPVPNADLICKTPLEKGIENMLSLKHP